MVYAGLTLKSADPDYGSRHSSEEAGAYLPCLILIILVATCNQRDAPNNAPVQ